MTEGEFRGAVQSYASMLLRCLDSKNQVYKNYGGRGITICHRWMDFRNFLEDMGGRPLGLTLERVDVNGNYEPSNCRWATKRDQARNTRSNKYAMFDGRPMLLADIARLVGVSASAISKRAAAGAPLGERRGIRLSEDVVAEIRRRNAESSSALGREFGVSRQTINAIRRGATWGGAA